MISTRHVVSSEEREKERETRSDKQRKKDRRKNRKSLCLLSFVAVVAVALFHC